ncbi:hypothetical protein [Arthrobacter sp. UYCu712]|uniref:hypothetical protein n=1 Tax=Arthrobacter sp. UYCu712 TaxID=3156340 RepID=UPI003398CD86
MSRPSIENLWDKLDPNTQEWLRANPGSVILPRGVTDVLQRASDRQEIFEGVDRNGQLPLSPQDQAFIKAEALSAPVGHPVPPGAPSH